MNNKNSVFLYLRRFRHVLQFLQFIAARQQLLSEGCSPCFTASYIVATSLGLWTCWSLITTRCSPGLPVTLSVFAATSLCEPGELLSKDNLQSLVTSQPVGPLLRALSRVQIFTLCLQLAHDVVQRLSALSWLSDIWRSRQSLNSLNVCNHLSGYLTRWLLHLVQATLWWVTDAEQEICSIVLRLIVSRSLHHRQ